MFEKGFKMVSGWPKGVKMALQNAFGAKSDRNGPFGGTSGASYSAFLERPHGKGNTPFYKKRSARW